MGQEKGVYADMVKESPQEIMAQLTDLDSSEGIKKENEETARKILPGYVPRTFKVRASTQTGEDKGVPDVSSLN